MTGLGSRGSALAAPILIILLLAMMILPLPAFILDLFFSFNIALSVIVLLTALYTVKPLDFMAFPAILLVSTILRLRHPDHHQLHRRHQGCGPYRRGRRTLRPGRDAW